MCVCVCICCFAQHRLYIRRLYIGDRDGLNFKMCDFVKPGFSLNLKISNVDLMLNTIHNLVQASELYVLCVVDVRVTFQSIWHDT